MISVQEYAKLQEKLKQAEQNAKQQAQRAAQAREELRKQQSGVHALPAHHSQQKHWMCHRSAPMSAVRLCGPRSIEASHQSRGAVRSCEECHCQGRWVWRACSWRKLVRARGQLPRMNERFA